MLLRKTCSNMYARTVKSVTVSIPKLFIVIYNKAVKKQILQTNIISHN